MLGWVSGGSWSRVLSLMVSVSPIVSQQSTMLHDLDQHRDHADPPGLLGFVLTGVPLSSTRWASA